MALCIPVTILGTKHCIPVEILTRPTFHWPPDPWPGTRTPVGDDRPQPDPWDGSFGLTPDQLRHVLSLSALEQIVREMPREVAADFQATIAKQVAGLARAGAPVTL